MTAEEYVVQRLKEAEEKIRDMEQELERSKEAIKQADHELGNIESILGLIIQDGSYMKGDGIFINANAVWKSSDPDKYDMLLGYLKSHRLLKED